MGPGPVFARRAPVSSPHSKFLRNGQALGAREQSAERGHLARDGFAKMRKGLFEERHIPGLCPGDTNLDRGGVGIR